MGFFSYVRKRFGNKEGMGKRSVFVEHVRSSKNVQKHIGICSEALISHFGIVKTMKTKKKQKKTKNIKKSLMFSPIEPLYKAPMRALFGDLHLSKKSQCVPTRGIGNPKYFYPDDSSSSTRVIAFFKQMIVFFLHT